LAQRLELLQHQGTSEVICQLWVRLDGWFTEGSGTGDLQEVKALLEGLS
jgi:hypothetical protein